MVLAGSIASLVLLAPTVVAQTPSTSESETETPTSTEESTETSSNDEAASTEAETPEAKARRLVSEARRAYHGARWTEARLRYEDAYQTAPDATPLRVQAALGLSTLLWEQGQYAKARTYIEEALSLARELELNDPIGRLLLTLGHIEGSLGQLESAEQTLNLCVQLASNQNDPVFAPLCRINHRLVRKLQGKSVGPKSEYREALKQLESVDNPLTVGLSLAKTAELHAKGGETQRAFSLLDSAESRYDEAGSRPAQARHRLLKARFLQDAGKWAQARSELDGLLEEFQRMGSKPAMVDTLGLLGNGAERRGGYEQARTYYARALRLARETGSPQKIAKVQLSFCEVSAHAGGTEKTEPCRRAIETFGELGMPLLEARSTSALGRNLYKTGSNSEARSHFLDAMRIRDEKVHPELVDDYARARDLANLCQIEMREKVTGAFNRCRTTLELLDNANIDRPRMLAATHYAAGIAAKREGHVEEALSHLKKGIEGYVALEPIDVTAVADAHLRRGSIFKQTDRPDEAAEAFKAGLDDVQKAEGDRLATVIDLRTQYAQQQLALEQWKKAAEQLETLAKEAEQVGDAGTRAWAYSTLARARNRLESSNEASAREALETALPLAKEAGDEELVETIESNLKAFRGDESGSEPGE